MPSTVPPRLIVLRYTRYQNHSGWLGSNEVSPQTLKSLKACKTSPPANLKENKFCNDYERYRQSIEIRLSNTDLGRYPLVTSTLLSQRDLEKNVQRNRATRALSKLNSRISRWALARISHSRVLSSEPAGGASTRTFSTKTTACSLGEP